MNQTVKDAWIAALRGGTYTQGHRTLREGESYCCLGVLCDLHARATGGGEWKTRDHQLYYYEPSNCIGANMDLPFAVAEWAGLNSTDPVIEDHTLSSWNDKIFDPGVKSFLEIAELIEKGL